MTRRGRRCIGAAVLASALSLTAGCFGDQPTLRPADLDDIRVMTESWTGVPLPAQMTLVRGDYVSAFLDPSLSAVFDAPSAEVDRFVRALGTRETEEFAADCADLSKPVRFDRVSARPQKLDDAGVIVVGEGVLDSLAGYAREGVIERCRDVTTVQARPRGVFVSMTIQAGPAGASRVVLSVVTT